MKSIILDDTLSKRLDSHKTTPDKSFSSSTKSGTLGALLDSTREHKTGDLPSNDRMEAAIEERSDVKFDPWAS